MSLHRRVLAESFETLPEAIKGIHGQDGRRHLAGRVDVKCNQTLAGRLLLRLLGLPRPGEDLEARILLEPSGEGERWHRRFGRDSFSSRVTPDRQTPGRIIETMGGVSAVIALQTIPDGLRWEVTSLSFLGVPLPRAIAPKTQATERQIDGRYRFEVSIRLPLLGPLISYQGWLQPAGSQATQSEA